MITRCMRTCITIVAALTLAGCSSEPQGVAPIGIGPAYRPSSLNATVKAAKALPGLPCKAHAAQSWVHLELFAKGHVMIVPAGIGVAPPRTRDGAYIQGGRCRYPLFTEEPTGLIGVARPGLTLGDLFAVWDQPLTRDRLVGFKAPVRVHVDGRRWTADPGLVPLRPYAQIVVEAGGPAIEPHADYTFPAGR